MGLGDAIKKALLASPEPETEEEKKKRLARLAAMKQLAGTDYDRKSQIDKAVDDAQK